MPGEGERGGERAVVYCLVPWNLADRLHEPLRRHFSDVPGVEVVVERRRRDRRRTGERRVREPEGREPESRRIRGASGRRAGERRAALVPTEPLPLPRRARRYADRIAFVERVEPAPLHAEDLDSARLVARFQAGDRDLFSPLYLRYFDRVYAYLLVILRNQHEAEDATQQVFMKALEALPRYVLRGQPFRAWLFAIARNHALSELEKRSRVELVSPHEMDHEPEPADFEALEWISDRDLLLFVERLPLAQRQVLVLRYMLDLTSEQAAAVLGRNPENVRTLQRRAIAFLRERLTALGRGGAPHGTRPRMRRRRSQAVVLRSRRFALTRR